jgi:four helix bundle protein
MKEGNVIEQKSKAFALRIISLYQLLSNDKHEYVLSKQLLRSGTSIGANVKEGVRAQSTPDFIAKFSIALKEAEETEYWLELLYESNILEQTLFNSVYSDNKELLKILTSIIKTSKFNNDIKL